MNAEKEKGLPFLGPEISVVPTSAVLESEDVALYLVDGTTYLHIQTSEDNRSYTRDDRYTTYGYTLYDKESLRRLDGGQMEIVEDARDVPRQCLYMAAKNILECRTLLGGATIEPVPLDMLQDAAVRERQAAESRTNDKAPRPSLRDSLKQCWEESKAQTGEPPAKSRRESER